MCRHIFLHPDCDRRPWHRTRSADPRPEKSEALAGSRLAPHTAGGEFHPALKTCAGSKAGAAIFGQRVRRGCHLHDTARDEAREGIDFSDAATEKLSIHHMGAAPHHAHLGTTGRTMRRRHLFFYEINAWFPKNLTFANAAACAALSDAQRQAVRQSASAAETAGWAASRVAATESAQELRRNGLRIEPAPPLLQPVIRRLGERFSLEWLQSVGREANEVFVPFYATR